MAHYNTILSKITAFIPRHEFDAHADTHHDAGDGGRDIAGGDDLQGVVA